MNLETCKYLGGVGAILLIIGSLAGIGYGFAGLLDLVGLILVLIALGGLAGQYKESGIFNNVIYGIVSVIIGAVVFGLLIFFVLVNFLTSLPGYSSVNWSDPNSISNFFTNLVSNPSNYNSLLTVAAQGILAWVVFIIFLSIGGYLVWRALRTLGAKSRVGLFGTAGLLIFIGAILTIIFIGLVLVWISFILLAIAFFQIKPQAPQPAPPPPPQ